MNTNTKISKNLSFQKGPIKQRMCKIDNEGFASLFFSKTLDVDAILAFVSKFPNATFTVQTPLVEATHNITVEEILSRIKILKYQFESCKQCDVEYAIADKKIKISFYELIDDLDD